MPAIKPSFLPEIIEKVLHRLEERLSNSIEKQLTTEEYVELNALFQEEVLLKAFNIIDTQLIISYRQENGIGELIEISKPWPSQSVYKLFPDINYCHCSYFREEILNAAAGAPCYSCEHVIAARLARILNKLKIEILPNHKFNYILKQIALD